MLKMFCIIYYVIYNKYDSGFDFMNNSLLIIILSMEIIHFAQRSI